MTQEPEYIINGTKVEVGQVYTNDMNDKIYIRDIEYDFKKIHGIDLARGENYIFEYDGSYQSILMGGEKDLIKCVGRFTSLEEVKERDKYLDTLLELYSAAKGLCFGVDWNNGTHANHHRKTLEDCVKKINEFDNFLQRLEINVKTPQPVQIEPKQPKKLKLSAGEMVELAIKCMPQHVKFAGTYADSIKYAANKLTDIIHEVENRPELMEYLA